MPFDESEVSQPQSLRVPVPMTGSGLQPLNLALVQTRLHWHDRAANLAHLDQVLEPLEHADLVVLPEMFTTGFTNQAVDVAETMTGPAVAWLQAQSRRLNAVVCGSLAMRDCGQHFNRFLWVTPAGDLSWYDKRHRFRMAQEDQHYAGGSDRPVFLLGPWRIRPIVCYDLRFPVWCRNRGDYDLLLCVANWPAQRRYAWATLLAARAIENIAHVVGVNRVGTDGNGLDYAGDSMVLGPAGEPLATLGEGKEGVIERCLSLPDLSEFRARFPAHLDADLFELVPGKGDPPP